MPVAILAVFGALLRMFLRCNGITGIQKTVVDQTTSRPPKSDHDPFVVQVSLWEGLLLGPTTEPAVASCHRKSTFHNTSQSNRERVYCFYIK